MQRWQLTALVGLLVLTLVSLSWTRSGSFMNAVTGAPGEDNCTDCHSGTANAGPGSAGITAPAEYTPGDTIDLAVNVAQTGQTRWGFEITALDATNQPAGQFIISDAAHTQQRTTGATGRQYVYQTGAGTYSGTANASPGWSMRWVESETGIGPVTFWLAGLAADGSGSGGDFTYTASRTVNEATTTDVDEPLGGTRPTQFALDQNYPNPFNPSTTIDYFLPKAAAVDLAVFNLLGQEIRTIDRGPRTAGQHSARWDGRDQHGQPVASGYYIYRLRAGEIEESRGMLYLK